MANHAIQLLDFTRTQMRTEKERCHYLSKLIRGKRGGQEKKKRGKSRGQFHFQGKNERHTGPMEIIAKGTASASNVKNFSGSKEKITWIYSPSHRVER